MGSSESTGRSNGGNNEEEEERPSIGAAAAVIGTAAVAAWGVSRMLKNSEDEKLDIGTSSSSYGRPQGRSLPLIFAPGRPAPPRFKLKTDGACLPNHEYNGVSRGPSGYAGILEDAGGNLVRGFRGFIGVSDCFTAEIHGILKGLELLDRLGYEGSILENDSQAAVDWVTGDHVVPSKSGVVGDCRDLIIKSRVLVRENKVTVRRCSRNANKLADKLVGIAINKQEAYVEFTNVHGEINGLPLIFAPGRPAPPRFKLKTDGACLSNPNPNPNRGDHEYNDDRVLRGPSGYAGILEDDGGKLVLGFRGFIGESDCLTAEIHGILKGLELLDTLGYKGSILENDSQAAVYWVTGEDHAAPRKSGVVRDCWDLIIKSRQLVHENNVTVRSFSRDDNELADKLARIAIKKREAYVEFIDVHGEINGHR